VPVVAAGVNRFRHSVHRGRFAIGRQGHQLAVSPPGVDHESAAPAAADAALLDHECAARWISRKAPLKEEGGYPRALT
jgi:hypothetical protein